MCTASPLHHRNHRHTTTPPQTPPPPSARMHTMPAMHGLLGCHGASWICPAHRVQREREREREGGREGEDVGRKRLLEWRTGGDMRWGGQQRKKKTQREIAEGLKTKIKASVGGGERVGRKKKRQKAAKRLKRRQQQQQEEQSPLKKSHNFWCKRAAWQEAVTPSVLYPSAHHSIPALHTYTSSPFMGSPAGRGLGAVVAVQTQTHSYTHSCTQSHLRRPVEKHFLDRLQQAR